tara:strand:+ start:6170 stop:6505 length:336 start_codon:yes stop_codon:yes gene_type:complete
MLKTLMNNKIKLYKHEINNIYNAGKHINSSYVKLITLKNSYNQNRLVFSIKKQHANAVERNKIKRRITAIIRKNEQINGFDMVVSVFPQIKIATFTELEEDFKKMLVKLEK